MLLSAPSMPRLPTRPALLILLLELSNPQLKEVQFFPKPAVLLATLPVLLLAELMVVLYVTIFRLIGNKSWEWLANEVKVERGCVARCVHWLKVRRWN
uniref:Uncharacterized protein n=1 Tax=Oryza meridionalis TaxID=40149 RepID=A0A0E0DQ82_9ORYZ